MINVNWCCGQELERIARRDPLHPISLQEKVLLDRLREDCKSMHQTILPRIIDCVNYQDYGQVKELHNLIRIVLCFYSGKPENGVLGKYNVKQGWKSSSCE